MILDWYKKTYKAKEQGSVAVIVALSLTVLLGCGAIVTDLGMLYAQKARLQSAVDAAVLAGVQELPMHPDLALYNASEYATKNGISTVTAEVIGNNSKLNVKAEQLAPTYFAKIWGIANQNIEATATAQVIPPRSLTGAVPLSVQEHEFVYGAQYVLKSGSGNSMSIGGATAGWYGALDLSGGGARDYKDDLIHGYSGTLSIGQVVNVEHGNMSGPTRDGVNERLKQDDRNPPNTFEDHDRDAPQIVYVPVVRPLSGNESSIHQVEIVGFAAFFLEGVAGNGNENYVTGRFLKTLVPHGQSNGGTLSDLLRSEEEMNNGTIQSDFGLYSVKLIK